MKMLFPFLIVTTENSYRYNHICDANAVWGILLFSLYGHHDYYQLVPVPLLSLRFSTQLSINDQREETVQTHSPVSGVTTSWKISMSKCTVTIFKNIREYGFLWYYGIKCCWGNFRCHMFPWIFNMQGMYKEQVWLYCKVKCYLNLTDV